MAALERVDGLFGTERHVQIEGRQVHFAWAIGQKGDAPSISLIFNLLLIAAVSVAFGQLEYVLVEILEVRRILGAQVDVVKLRRHL